jgi:23S rRNA pseudouridine1911/1915/1917 synthase
MTIRGNARVDILFEDNHLLVVNKPALLPTMGTQPGDASLYNWAGEYLKRKYNKPGNVYVGVVSRLDSHTSGVIVLARTSKAASRLSDQLRRGSVTKRYLALIPAGLQPPRGQLSDRLVKNESRHRMEVVPESAAKVSGEKQALLEYQTVDQNDSVQALQVDLKTGRKHQIRVQLEHAGFPILGDRKYGSQRRWPTGIALHCFQLSFLHPTLKTVQSFQVTPPPDWPTSGLKKLASFVSQT